MQIEASLRAARLDLLAADATPSWRGRDLQLELSGALPALRLSARGQLERGTRRYPPDPPGITGGCRSVAGPDDCPADRGKARVTIRGSR